MQKQWNRPATKQQGKGKRILSAPLSAACGLGCQGARLAGVWDEIWKNVIVLVSISFLDFLSARLLCHCIFFNLFFFDTSETSGLFSFLCVVLRSTLRSPLVDRSRVEIIYFKPFHSWSMSKNFLWLNDLSKISGLPLLMVGPAVYTYIFCMLTEAKLQQCAVPTEPASERNLQCFHTFSSLICLSQN